MGKIRQEMWSKNQTKNPGGLSFVFTTKFKVKPWPQQILGFYFIYIFLNLFYFKEKHIFINNEIKLFHPTLKKKGKIENFI